RRHTRSKRDWSSDVCSSDLSPSQHRSKPKAPSTPAFSKPSSMPKTTKPVVRCKTKPKPSSPPSTHKYPKSVIDIRTRFDRCKSRSEERRVGTDGKDRWSQAA